MKAKQGFNKSIAWQFYISYYTYMYIKRNVLPSQHHVLTLVGIIKL